MLARMDVRVMLAELIRWKRLASSYKLSLSEFVRARMNNTKIRVVAVTDPALINEYKRHNNNLNQLLHAIHGGFPIDASRVEAVIAALHALYLRDIERG